MKGTKWNPTFPIIGSCCPHHPHQPSPKKPWWEGELEERGYGKCKTKLASHGASASCGKSNFMGCGWELRASTLSSLGLALPINNPDGMLGPFWHWEHVILTQMYRHLLETVTHHSTACSHTALKYCRLFCLGLPLITEPISPLGGKPFKRCYWSEVLPFWGLGGSGRSTGFAARQIWVWPWWFRAELPRKFNIGCFLNLWNGVCIWLLHSELRRIIYVQFSETPRALRLAVIKFI